MSEELFAAVKELLPEIERELREEISAQLETDYQQKLEEHINKTRDEAKLELESIFQEIQQQTFATFQEKLAELEQREKALDENRAVVEKGIREDVEQALRQQYEHEKQSLAQHVLEEFNQQMMGGEIEEKLRERIQAEMDDRLRVELEKKEKLMKVNFKRKFEQEKKLLEEGLELEWKQKVDNEKRQLETERSEIARLRSLQNIRLKKLEDEKKQFKLQMREQEQKYQEIVQSLQVQIQQLETELQELQRKQQDLQNQYQQDISQSHHEQDSSQMVPAEPLSWFKRGRNNNNSISEDTFVPVYQHQRMFEPESVESTSIKKTLFKSSPRDKYAEAIQPQKPTDVNKYLFGDVEQSTKSIIDKDTAKSFIQKYQDELSKLITKQNKENTQVHNEIPQPPANIKYQEALRTKLELPSTQRPAQQVQPQLYENLFLPNDLDNEKNQQMKLFRKDLLSRLAKDTATLPKYEASQLYMRTDFLKKYDKDNAKAEFQGLLEQLFEAFAQVTLNAQERLDFLKYLQFQAQPTSLSSLVPIMQNKIFQLRQLIQALPANTLEQMKRRDDLRNNISLRWVSFTKSKADFQELVNIGTKLRNLKFKWRGIECEELFKLDAWEMEYLQREELKNQLLHKIQTKIL